MPAVDIMSFLELTLIFEAEHAYVLKWSRSAEYLMCALGCSLLRRCKQVAAA